MKNHTTRPTLLTALLLVPALVWGQGMGRGNQQDMATIHGLLGNNTKITRTVTKLKNGVQTLTESNDPVVAAMIHEHAAAMRARLKEGRPIRMWDPLFVELFANASKISLALTNTQRGVKVVETSDDPYVVTLIQWHAEGVNGFVKEGMAGMHKEHPAPPKPTTGPKSGFKGVGDGVTTCPVTGEPVDKDVSAVIQGRTVYFCCEGCVEKVTTHPALYLRWAAGGQDSAQGPMAAFDAIYIPALALTSQAQADRSVAPQARAAASKLFDVWPSAHERLLWAISGDPSWASSLDRVGQAVQRGLGFSLDGDFGAAHEALEEVRLMLMAGRKRAGIEYFVDRLTAFHEPMEALVLAAKGKRPAQVDGAFRSKLQAMLVNAESLWLDVEAHLANAATSGLDPRRQSLLREAVWAESVALMRLREALASGSSSAVLQAAAALKPPFAKAFMAFGDFGS